MSAIYGYIKKTESVSDILTPLQRWNDFYGEDGKNTIETELSGMGCSLHHIPINVSKSNPVLFFDGGYAVFDALLYNRDELGELLSLKKEELSELSDEELLLKVWLQTGEKGLRIVNGDFAGAVFQNGELSLFRDHLGVRILYYYLDDNLFAFSTDIRGILAIPGTDHSFDEVQLYAEMTKNYVDYSRDTFFAKIKIVPSATVVTFPVDGEDKFRLKESEYWRLKEKKIRLSGKKEYQIKARELVYDAVRRRVEVLSGQPVGAEMSGGLDSSVIDVLMKKFGADVHCCTWSPPYEQNPMQDHDERYIIDKTCEKFGLVCHYEKDKAWVFPDLDDILKEPRTIRDGEDMIDRSMKYFHSVGAKAAFSGWGGDEGISRRCHPLELWYAGEYLHFLNVAWKRTPGRLKKIYRYPKRLFKYLIHDHKAFQSTTDFYEKNDLEFPTFIKSSFYEDIKDRIKILPFPFAIDPVRQIAEGGNRFRTQSVSDRGGLFKVQYIFPYLDYRVEDFAVSIPRYLYLKGPEERVLYREAFRDDMIDELYTYRFKDDPGKGTVYLKQLYGDQDELRSFYYGMFQVLDEKLWDKYIDFLELQDAIEKDIKADLQDKALFLRVMLELLVCLQGLYNL